MKTRLAKQWAGAMSWLRLREALYLLLLLFVIWHLAGAGFRVFRFFSSATASIEDIGQLDSFSQPSIARAILKQEADRLLAAYLRDCQQGLEIEAAQNLAQAGNQTPQRLLPPSACAKGRSPRAQTIAQLTKLQQTVEELDSDLDRALLMVYSQNGLWNEFVDHYLHLACAEPQSFAIPCWAWMALDYSQRCNRNAEVVDALEHLLQFHPELKTTRGLKTTLEEWRAARTGIRDCSKACEEQKP